MSLLERISNPSDLQRLSHQQLLDLSSEIRKVLIEKVSRSGGHLGPNLGVVELTIAIHRIFESPHDVILFDTGHQSYVHKMLTGRLAGFEKLRQRGGLAGYPSRSESPHDVIENSHASTALSWADGIARGFQVQGIKDRFVVAVVGDGFPPFSKAVLGAGEKKLGAGEVGGLRAGFDELFGQFDDFLVTAPIVGLEHFFAGVPRGIFGPRA